MATTKKPEPQRPGRTPATAQQPDGPQDIDTLKGRYDELREAQITAAANLKTAESQLAKLRAQAKATYGTDDLAALKAKLEEMTADNERKRNEYQSALDKIEADLGTIEEKYSQSTQAEGA